jgi:predicted kinase
LIPELRALSNDFRLNIQYISPDEKRKQVLDDPEMDLRDPSNTFRLKYSSAAAFAMLEKHVEQVTLFPVNAEFVIVDSTALNKDFRAKIIDLAQRNHYNIDLLLFDLPTREYYKYADGQDYVSDHIRRLQTEVFPCLDVNNYGQVLRIKDRERIAPVTEIINFDLYKRCHFPHDAVLVGDIHGCIESLLEIEKVSKKLPMIMLGDVIDKGENSLEVLCHLRDNPQKYPLLVMGNHERYVYQYLHGLLEENPKHDYFTSIRQYENSAEFRELIDWYYGEAVPFAKIRDSIYVTHAPCEDKYIGKIDCVSQRKQSYCQVSGDNVEKLREESNIWRPRHIFGHVAFRRPFEFRNKIGIDTGGVYGNKFSYFMSGKVWSVAAKRSYAEYKLLDVPTDEL